jgi:hypothetical protein
MTSDTPTPPIDIVFTVGSGSNWKDKELMYALRGIQQHAKNYRGVVIVGHLLAFVNPQRVHSSFKSSRCACLRQRAAKR